MPTEMENPLHKLTPEQLEEIGKEFDALHEEIKDDLGVTVRCIPLGPGEPGICPFTGQPSPRRVVWAKSY